MARLVIREGLINTGNMRGRLLDWLVRKHEVKLAQRYGGLQKCPWCRQLTQLGDGWYFEPWDQDITLDQLTCGVCGGTSLYRFEIGMIYIRALEPPKPAWPDAEGYDGYFARLENPEGISIGKLQPDSGGPDAP